MRRRDMPCTKWTVFSVNIFFSLLGLALLIGGTALLFVYQHHENFTAAQIRSVPMILIFIGTFSFIFAFLGACGAICRSSCLTYFSSVVILIILLSQLELVIFSSLKPNDMSTFWNNSFNDMLENHKAHDETWKFMQRQLECCGVDSPNDWINLNNNGTFLPPSCCARSHENSCTGLNAYKTGCRQALLDFFDKYSWVSFGLIIALVLVQILLFGLSCSLHGTYRKGSDAYEMEERTSF